MNEKRIIKKYPNRRLYDTKDSKYITLEDIAILVSESKKFVVIDSKTGKEVCHARTGAVFFNYANRNITETPEKFRSKFQFFVARNSKKMFPF